MFSAVQKRTVGVSVLTAYNMANLTYSLHEDNHNIQCPNVSQQQHQQCSGLRYPGESTCFYKHVRQ